MMKPGHILTLLAVLLTLALAAPASPFSGHDRAAQAAPLAAPQSPAANGDIIVMPEEVIGGGQVVFGATAAQAYAFAGTRLMLYHTASVNFPILLSQFVPFPGEPIYAAALYQERYAFVLTSSRLAVLDLGVFTLPRTLASFNNPAWNRLHIVDQLLVLAGSYQVNLYQINSPESIVSLSGDSFTDYATRDVFVGTRFYRATPAGLEVVDFSNPLSITRQTIPYTLDWNVYGLAVRPPFVFLHGYVQNKGYFLQSLNFTDLNSPQLLYSGYSSYADNLTAVGNYGYACSGGYLRLFDLTNPGFPYYLGEPNHPCTANGSFLSGSRYYSGGSILDVADPMVPKLLGRMLNGMDMDLVVSGNPAADDRNRVYTFAERHLLIYEVDGLAWRHLGGLVLNEQDYRQAVAAYPYLYLVGYDFVDVVNASVPARPSMVSRHKVFSYGPRAVAFYDAGPKDYLYIAHEDQKLTAVDVTNPADPAVTVATAQLSLSGVAESMLMVGNRLAVATGYSGVQIYDLSNPAVPVLYWSYPASPAFGLAVKNGLLLVAENSQVLVFDVTSQSPGLVKTLGYPAKQLLVSGNLLYALNGNVLNLLDIANLSSERWISFTDLGADGRLFSGGAGTYWLKNNGPVHYMRPVPVESKHLVSTGDQFAAADGTYTLDLPACAIGFDFTAFQTYPAPASAAPNLVPVRGAVDFDFVHFSNSTSGANCPFTLHAAYQPAAVTGLDESSLAVYFWSGSEWVREPSSTLDVANQVVTAQLPAGIRRWGLFAPLAQGQRTMYIPVVQAANPITSLAAPASVDLSVQAIEPIQVTNPATGFSPLVAGKQTVVRVYVNSGAGVPVFKVRLALHGRLNNNPLPGSPLVVESGAALPLPYRESLATTTNFVLPASWLQPGTLALTVVLDDQSLIAETNEGNNAASTSVVLNSVNPLQIVFVPIEYTHTPTGAVFQPAENHDLSYALRQIFPIPGVSVAFRPAVAFAGNLSEGSEWNRLLAFISSVKDSDGAQPRTIYYGVIPTFNSNGDTYPRAWGGYGYISRRVAIGTQGGVTTFAHEAGHNLGLNHAPCGNPSGPDPSYPYTDGRIGWFGVSAATLTGYNPVVSKDFMTYCSPKWVSDYFYQRMYNNQRSAGMLADEGVAAPQEVYLLRAFGGDGALALQPVYRATQSAGLAAGSPPSEVWADALDADGRVLASVEMQKTLLAVEDLGGQGYAWEVSASLPAVPGAARLVIREGRQALAVQDLTAAPDSAVQSAAVNLVDGVQSLSWSGAEGLLRVAIRSSADQPWMLYAQDWPADLPLALPAGQWQVQWSAANAAAPAATIIP